MLPLLELQRNFRRALLDGDAAAIAGATLPDELDADQRLEVYRNNLFTSLTEVLKEVFPAVCRLVDVRCFAYLANEFIRAAPPERACLSEYGGRFPDFLAEFPACRHLAYLPDVARLEWLMHSAAHSADVEPMTPAALAAVRGEDTPRLVFSLHPSFSYLSSPWPIDAIWRANRDDAENEAPVDLAAGDVYLEISHRGEEIVLRCLDTGTFAFRQTLSSGSTLHAATEAALAAGRAFDLTAAFADLLRDGALTGFSLALAPEEDRK